MTKLMIDCLNASTEVVAVISAALDIRTAFKDGAVQHGFNVWMKLYWLFYGVWQSFVAYYVPLPVTALVIVVWVPIYTFSIIQAIHYRIRQGAI